MRKLDGNAMGLIILLIIVIWILANGNAVAHIINNMSAIGK